MEPSGRTQVELFASIDTALFVKELSSLLCGEVRDGGGNMPKSKQLLGVDDSAMSTDRIFDPSARGPSELRVTAWAWPTKSGSPNSSVAGVYPPNGGAPLLPL
mmetsp:Transcript_14232/g.17927  ORF Transcript_14232/g.17927 Transcript_14232/m.17927 type:complete len:103 (+) Transcript_14232:1054-1362(+)